MRPRFSITLGHNGQNMHRGDDRAAAVEMAEYLSDAERSKGEWWANSDVHFYADGALVAQHLKPSSIVEDREAQANRRVWAERIQPVLDAAKAAKSQPGVWVPATIAAFDYFLNVLPPAFWEAGRFAVGEPEDHDPVTGRAIYLCFRTVAQGSYLARYCTVSELKAA